VRPSRKSGLPVSNPASRTDRAGKKVVAGHFSAGVAKSLKILAAENETTVQSMLAEAIRDLFNKHKVSTPVD